jgi:hypothetical protein
MRDAVRSATNVHAHGQRHTDADHDVLVDPDRMHLLVVHDANLLAPKHQHLKMEQPRRHSKTTTDLPQKLALHESRVELDELPVVLRHGLDVHLARRRHHVDDVDAEERTRHARHVLVLGRPNTTTIVSTRRHVQGNTGGAYQAHTARKLGRDLKNVTVS